MNAHLHFFALLKVATSIEFDFTLFFICLKIRNGKRHDGLVNFGFSAIPKNSPKNTACLYSLCL